MVVELRDFLVEIPLIIKIPTIMCGQYNIQLKKTLKLFIRYHHSKDFKLNRTFQNVLEDMMSQEPTTL